MAFGDKKSAKPTYSGGSSRYNYGYTKSYDDGGRGTSKSYFEEFQKFWEAAGYKKSWILPKNNPRTLTEGLTDARLHTYVEMMKARYGIHDWAWQKFEDSDDNDGRVRRLVIDKTSIGDWRAFQKRAKEVVDVRAEEELKQQELREAEMAERQAAFRAQQLKRDTESKQEIMKTVELSVGSIKADFDMALGTEDTFYLDDGDYLDDPVEGVISGYGMGMETKTPEGIKLQITLSIDKSNSMQSNKLTRPAGDAFRDMWLALEKLEKQYQGDLFIACFDFANDGYVWNQTKTNRVWKTGAEANCLSVNYYPWSGSHEIVRSKDEKLGPVERYRESGSAYHSFSGEDTWLHPLFEEIERWENEFSDPGAHKLDIIITDAVLEHKVDIVRSDVVQERRNGSLQTVFLNFIPQEHWADHDLPKRCVQYAANPDTIDGLLRNLVSQFVNSYI